MRELGGAGGHGIRRTRFGERARNNAFHELDAAAQVIVLPTRLDAHGVDAAVGVPAVLVERGGHQDGVTPGRDHAGTHGGEAAIRAIVRRVAHTTDGIRPGHLVAHAGLGLGSCRSLESTSASGGVEALANARFRRVASGIVYILRLLQHRVTADIVGAARRHARLSGHAGQINDGGPVHAVINGFGERVPSRFAGLDEIARSIIPPLARQRLRDVSRRRIDAVNLALVHPPPGVVKATCASGAVLVIHRGVVIRHLGDAVQVVMLRDRDQPRVPSSAV